MLIFPNWFIGIFLTILSTAIGSLGKVLIRCVHLIQSSPGYIPFLQTKYSSFPLISTWIIKCPTILLSIIAQLFVIVINPILSILSYTYAAQSLLTPFAGLSIVWSLLFSSFLLPEIPDQSKYKSVFMITVYPFSQSYSYFPLF